MIIIVTDPARDLPELAKHLPNLAKQVSIKCHVTPERYPNESDASYAMRSAYQGSNLANLYGAR